jgi:uncharacterized protein YbgA (DUF1722 family)/uncharacterized protein YbbK (DUF523 family)
MLKRLASELGNLANMAETQSLRIGISRCLLGDEVRFDGGHKRDPFLTDTLGRYVQWVPVCPEVEVGMGTPREAMRLVGTAQEPRLITIKTGIDHTRSMQQFSQGRVRELAVLDLCGYVFKKDSPSCGVERVRIYNPHGIATRNGTGLFAQTFMDHFPLIPIEEEERLNDPLLRENFIERVFAYWRWRNLMRSRVTRQAVVGFHTIQKYLLLAHSHSHFQALGQLVGNAKRYSPVDLAQRYGVLFMEALKVKATVRKHVNTLQHIMSSFKDQLSKKENEELRGVIDDYHEGLAPLIVPITLVRHYVNLFEVTYIQNQVYLNPHPKELMLRNRV